MIKSLGVLLSGRARVRDRTDITAEEPVEKYPSTGASNGSDVAVSVPTEASSDAAVKDPVEASATSELDRTEDPVDGLKGTEAVEGMEEVADKEEGEDVERNIDAEDDDDSQPLPPENMFFGPTEYIKVCKVGSRCQLVQTVAMIEGIDAELKWFRNHDQFKHMFHMPKEPNHMLQGMWMLMVRTAKTDMVRECWFVVNGVPIRYSMKEHALLTGLACHEYPKNLEKIGSLKFVRNIFGRTNQIKIKDVEKKLKEFKDQECVARKKLTILLFLCKVLKADSKGDANIEQLLLRIVNNVAACETFPWGRYSFEQCMEGIRRVMKNMKGSVKPKAQTSFYGFITPLEVSLQIIMNYSFELIII